MQICKEVLTYMTEGRIVLESGTVYGTLTKIKKDGIVAVYSNEERKTVYEITELGRELIALEIERIKELNRNAIRLGGKFNE